MAKFRLDLIVKAAEKQGWRVRDTGRALLFFPADVALGHVTTHKTPSDHQARKNFRRDLERRGFVWPGEVKW